MVYGIKKHMIGDIKDVLMEYDPVVSAKLDGIEDFEKYLAWLDAGRKPTEADEGDAAMDEAFQKVMDIIARG